MSRFLWFTVYMTSELYQRIFIYQSNIFFTVKIILYSATFTEFSYANLVIFLGDIENKMCCIL